MLASGLKQYGARADGWSWNMNHTWDHWIAEYAQRADCFTNFSSQEWLIFICTGKGAVTFLGAAA